MPDTSQQTTDRSIGLLHGQMQQLMSAITELKSDMTGAMRELKESLGGDMRDLKADIKDLEGRVRKLEIDDAEDKPLMDANKQIIAAIFKYGLTAIIAAGAAYVSVGGM